MAKYRVTIKEVWNQDVIIEADSPEDAKNKVGEARGTYDETSFQYNYTLDPGEWFVEEEV